MRPGKPVAALLVAALLAVACGRNPPPALLAPGREAAVVAMPDAFGAAVAEDVLRRGGNAVDAAVAAAFALAVTYPEAGNLGGGGLMLVYHAGQPAFLDYRETAPAAATADMYLDRSGEVIEDASRVGCRAAGVPGTVAGLWAAHQRYGRLGWAELLAPAIALARDGFVVPPQLASRVGRALERFSDRTGTCFSDNEISRAHEIGHIASEAVDQCGVVPFLGFETRFQILIPSTHDDQPNVQT